MIKLSKSKNTYLFLFLLLNLQLISCAQNKPKIIQKTVQKKQHIQTGADRTELYLSLLKGKRIAIVANQTSVIFKENRKKRIEKRVFTHLVDSLLSLNINVVKVFAPEHGFRGKADAGEHVQDGIDTKTKLPITSLYGKNRKPRLEQLKGIDIVVFDIQDIGVRFYTYISTLTYMMETCAEANIPVIVLDRPNPNGHYVDGPTLEKVHKSFLGMHPVPLVYGMTIGEYAQMVNGESWLENNLKCDLTVIGLKNYTHNSEIYLVIRPSPNIPNYKAVNLYPSLGFFEGTTINAGRGTEFQFQRYGAPFFPKSEFTYTPIPNFGSKYPKHKEKVCNGVDLKDVKKMNSVNPKWLIDAYQKTPKNKTFFGKTFTVHAGTKKLQQQIEQGLSADEIHKSWQKDIYKFKKIRAKYLMYK